MKLFVTLCLLFSCTAFAETRIAVLDFELQDLTLKPRIPAEIDRTASLKPLLERELKTAAYQIVSIDLTAQQHASAGVGYLFDHPDAVAKLANKAAVDYVVVGKLHKPSFLFAYLMAHLVRVRDGQLVGNYISEVKGADKKLTVKGIEDLTDKIDATLDHHYTRPAPAAKPLYLKNGVQNFND